MALSGGGSTSLTAQILKDPLNPFPWYRIMRQDHPAYYSPEFKSWFISRYEDVQRVVDDPALFSSQLAIRNWSSSQEPQTNRTLLWIDPPRHRQLRSLVMQAFTPRAIASLAPRISSIAHAHLDVVASTGSIDIVKDLANPLPIIVIAELLGVPSRDQQQFKHWSDIIVSPARSEKKLAINAMNAYFLDVVNQRRILPQDDLISALLAAQIDGVRLSDPEILSFCRLLLVAGHETSTNLIGSALLTLDEYPEAQEQLRADLSLIPSAVEEIVRYRTPIQRLRRAATRDTCIAGQDIRAGQIVSPILGAANRDETQFTTPEVFSLQRIPNRHIGFGHGIHFCIGAALARLETKIALETLLTRFSTLQRIQEVPLQAVTSSFVYGVRNLPMRFHAAS